MLAVVAPKPPPREVRQAVAGGGGGEDDEEDPLRLRLPANAPAWQRATLRFLQHRLRVPEAVLALALRAGWRFWLGLLAWSAGARLAAAYEAGPLYIVGSLIAGMLLNLGQRREGQWRCARAQLAAGCGAACVTPAARRCCRFGVTGTAFAVSPAPQPTGVAPASRSSSRPLAAHPSTHSPPHPPACPPAAPTLCSTRACAACQAK